jgi:hypothetical protein
VLSSIPPLTRLFYAARAFIALTKIEDVTVNPIAMPITILAVTTKPPIPDTTPKDVYTP